MEAQHRNVLPHRQMESQTIAARTERELRLHQTDERARHISSTKAGRQRSGNRATQRGFVLRKPPSAHLFPPLSVFDPEHGVRINSMNKPSSGSSLYPIFLFPMIHYRAEEQTQARMLGHREV